MVEATEPVRRVLDALSGAGRHHRSVASGWEAQCPAHDDQQASLSVTVGRDGRALVRCHANCETPEVIRALGLEMRDLFADQRNALREIKPPTQRPPAKASPAPSAREDRGELVATYDYVDERGELVSQALRFWNGKKKSFRQRRPDPAKPGAWIWKLEGARQIVYRLPQVLAGVAAGKTIWIVEGEKDVESLEKLGFVATCNAMGAGKWKPSHTEALAGATRAVIVADKDKPGREHAQHVASELQGWVTDVRVVEVPADGCKDATDWIQLGATVSQFEDLAAAAPTWSRDPEPLLEEPDHLRDAPPPEDQLGLSAEPPEPPHTADAPRSAPPPDADVKYPPLTDLGNAERLVTRHGEDLRYVAPLDAWFIWDGRRWARDHTGEIVRRATDTVRHIREDEKLVEPVKVDRDGRPDDVDQDRFDKETSAIWKWSVKSESAGRIEAMIRLAQTRSSVAVMPGAFDRDPWALNLLNGTLDLQTRTIRPQRKEDMITKLVPIRYDPTATCPRWAQFISEIFLADDDLIELVRRAIGYSLTASTREQCFFILYGTGQNGKGRLLKVLLRLMGGAEPGDGYSHTAAIETFSASRDAGGDKPRPDVIALRGKRIVTASEQDENVRLNEAFVKQVTGEDDITARDLHSAPITFPPEFKLWLAVNHRPKAYESGMGFWRRVRLIPFDYTVPDDKKDPELDSKLRAEMSGILNWALAGLESWLEKGLGKAERVEAATAEYRAEMDQVGRFIDECCVLLKGAFAPAGQLYDAYKKWAETNGERAWTQTRFGNKLTERGITATVGGHDNKRVRIGIGLKTSSDQIAPDRTDNNGDDCDRVNPIAPQPDRKPDRTAEGADSSTANSDCDRVRSGTSSFLNEKKKNDQVIHDHDPDRIYRDNSEDPIAPDRKEGFEV